VPFNPSSSQQAFRRNIAFPPTTPRVIPALRLQLGSSCKRLSVANQIISTHSRLSCQVIARHGRVSGEYTQCTGGRSPCGLVCLRLRHLRDDQARESLRQQSSKIRLLLTSEARTWWEHRRLRYNIGLVIGGVLAFVGYVAVVDRGISTGAMPCAEITLFTTAFQGIGFLFAVAAANICYLAGRFASQSSNHGTSTVSVMSPFSWGFGSLYCSRLRYRWLSSRLTSFTLHRLQSLVSHSWRKICSQARNQRGPIEQWDNFRSPWFPRWDAVHCAPRGSVCP
jgi:hypothetical protein